MPKIKKTRLETFLGNKIENNFYTIMTTIIFISLLLVASTSFAKHNWVENIYDFPARDMITMDVIKNDGVQGGGTYRCTSIYNCYMYVMAAEQRGATQYCKTITIKRDGRPVWFKRYQ